MERRLHDRAHATAPVVDKLFAAMKAASTNKGLQKRFEEQGVDLALDGPEELRGTVRRETGGLGPGDSRGEDRLEVMARPGLCAAQPDGAEWFFAAVGDRMARYVLAPDGSLHELDALAMPCKVQFACFDAARSLLYVACSNGGPGSRGDLHRLVLVEVGDGLCMPAAQMALPYRPIHAALDELGRRLLVAYNLPAAVTVHGLDASGAVCESAGPFEGPGLVGWFPHQVLPMPGSVDLLLTCRGDDATAERAENPGSLRVLRFEGGGLKARQVVAPNGGLGFGPRNCAFHPMSSWLYAVLERQNTLVSFRVHTGRIDPEPTYTVGLLQHPEHLHRPQLGGAIEIHPSGRFAYVVNRAHAVEPDAGRMVWAGGENSVAVFCLDTATGEPALQHFVPLNGLHARCIALAHGGTLLVVAIRQASARRTPAGIEDCPAGLSVFRIREDGSLTAIAHYPIDTGDQQLFWAGRAD